MSNDQSRSSAHTPHATSAPTVAAEAGDGGSPRTRRAPSRRAMVGVAAGTIAVSAALGIPALAANRGDAPDGSVTAVTAALSGALGLPASTTTTARPLTPEEQVAANLAAATPEQRWAFQRYFWTPEQELAFKFFVATPEERAAFVKFTTPPPAPVVARTSGGGAAKGGGSVNGGFLGCVRGRESRGQYGAVNGSSGAGGAYQFMPQTWNNTARHAGRPDLVGVHPSRASKADQDAMARSLYAWQGAAPWGGGC